MGWLRYGPQVRAEVLRRLAAGERLKHIGREPGMPCPESVTGWMRADAGFAAAVAEARARGETARRVFNEAQARRLLARLAGGEPIGRILGDPEMPSRRVYYRVWLGGAAPGWFQEEVFRLRQRAEAQRRDRARGRFRTFDPAVAERLYVRLWKGETTLRAVLRSDRTFPSQTVLARWRRENAAFDAQMRFLMTGLKRLRGRRGTLCTPEMTAAIVAHIRAGASFRSLARLPGMPSAGAMSNWVRDQPEFAQAVAEACEDRAEGLQDRMWEMVAGAPPMSRRDRQRLTAPLARQEARLRKRPGWTRA